MYNLISKLLGKGVF